MLRQWILLVVCSVLVNAFSRSEIMAGYGEFEQKVTAKNAVRDYAKTHLNHVKQIPQFIRFSKSKGISDVSKYYYSFLNIPDFGKKVWMNNYFSTIEYKYVLKHMKPQCSANGNTKKFTISLKYGNAMRDFIYNFNVHCRYKKRTTKVEDLGFFEVFGTGGMAESKNVTYDVYSCSLNRGDVRKIKAFGRRIGTNAFSQALQNYPKNKYVVVGKSYNKATYVAPAMTGYGGSGSSSTPASSSSSTQNYTCTFKCKGGDGIQSSVNVSESSNHKAQIKSAKLANRWCKDLGFSEGVLSQWGTGSTDCTKR